VLRLTQTILLLALLAAVSVPLVAQQNTIAVTGDAEVRVVPDEVVLSVGVETADKNLALAKQFNDERINRALAVTKKFAIPAQHVQTDYISLEPRHRQGEIFNELLGMWSGSPSLSVSRTSPNSRRCSQHCWNRA